MYSQIVIEVGGKISHDKISTQLVKKINKSKAIYYSRPYMHKIYSMCNNYNGDTTDLNSRVMEMLMK
jgi:hypothetical protein